MIVKIKKLDENAIIPFQRHVGEDACYDLIPVSCKYNPKYDRFEYGLGFATEFTPDWEAEIRPRSTNTKTDAYIPNAPGTIDSGYRGEWNVFYKLRTSFAELFPDCSSEVFDLCVLEMENEYAPYPIDGKTAIAQVKFNRVEHTDWIEVDTLSDTERGADGGLIREGK
jgi:dUTP pyrophosphatase